MSELVNGAPWRALDANGNPVAAAQARFFRTDTTTPLTVYSDAAGTVAHPVPLVADANGLFAPVFNTSAFGVKVDVTHPTTGASLPGYPNNLAIAASTATGAATEITFAPTGDIAETNVQGAIEQVQANWNAAKTGADAGLVSGTPGAANTVGQWNADGDLIGSLLIGTAANNLVQLDGSARLPAVNGSQLTSLNATPLWTRGSFTAVATGTAVDITSVSAPNELEIELDAVSLSGTDDLLIQIGTGGSPTTTGYVAATEVTSVAVTSTSGFILYMKAASLAMTGLITLRHVGSNKWIIASAGLNNTANAVLASGHVTLAGALDMVRITRTGTNNFDGSGQARVTGR